MTSATTSAHQSTHQPNNRSKFLTQAQTLFFHDFVLHRLGTTQRGFFALGGAAAAASSVLLPAASGFTDAKKSTSSATASSLRQPPMLSYGVPSSSVDEWIDNTEPLPPKRGLLQPKKTRATPTARSACAHMMHGSHVTKRSHPRSLSTSPRSTHLLIATSSACLVACQPPPTRLSPDPQQVTNRSGSKHCALS